MFSWVPGSSEGLVSFIDASANLRNRVLSHADSVGRLAILGRVETSIFW